MITHGHERIKHHGVTVAQKQLAHPHIGGSFSPRPCMSKCLQAKNTEPQTAPDMLSSVCDCVLMGWEGATRVVVSGISVGVNG